MGVLDDFLNAVGGVYRRAHLFSFSKVSADGVYPAFTRDLRPIHEDGLTGGHLVELWCVLDERDAKHRLTANSRIRFDILEEDFLLLGGLDDQVLSIVGTGAVAPDPAVPSVNRSVTFSGLPEGMSVPEYVELYKRTASLPPGSPPYDETILILDEPERAAGTPGTARTHVIAWWRAEHVSDIGANSELYFVLDVDNAQIEAASETLDLREAPPGVAVRLRGHVVDRQPLVAATPEPLFDIPVTLGGRMSITGDAGEFVIDARLPVGDHRLEFRRPGIDSLELTVRITADNAGKVTAAVFDGVNQLVTGTTAAAATQTSRLDLALPAPLQIRAHKLRGRVLWPDSRPGSEEPTPNPYVAMLPAYHGTPLAERRVYVLPLPAAGPLAAHRPMSTREWDRLKTRPSVLRSARPGRPVQRERTDVTGAFEVKYVDMTAGNRFLMWTERLDPKTPVDFVTETPEHVIRTLQGQLIELHELALGTTGDAANVLTRRRNLIDHEYNLTNDPIEWGVDAIRILDIAGARTLVRPDRVARQRFEEEVLAAGVGDRTAVPASRIVANLELQVLPLVHVGEAADRQSAAATRMRRELESAASAAFPQGFDLEPVELVLDTRRFNEWVDRTAAAPVLWQAGTADNAVVELLERTFVVRPQLRRGERLGVADARWHMDAMSLADRAFISVPAGAANPLVAQRTLDARVVPVVGAVVPVLPSLPAAHAYLAPGHGLWPRNVGNSSGATARADWVSDRAGYAANAGEDEVDALIASEIHRIGKAHELRMTSAREVENFTTAGVTNTAAGVFAPQAHAEFPRLWQQNPVFYLGFVNRGGGVAAGFSAPAGNKNNAGITIRANHIRAIAAASALDIVIAPHTNGLSLADRAANPNTRGTLVEYLNVQPAHNVIGEGNPASLAFAQKLLDQLDLRCRLPRRGQSRIAQDNPVVNPPTYAPPAGYARGLFTMNNINAVSIRDLTETFPHWVRISAAAEVLERRIAAAPPAAQAALWDPHPFPSVRSPVPVVLTELAFHDHPGDAAFLSRAWFRRLAGEAMAEAIDGQVREDLTAITGDKLVRVLRHLFGQTPAVRAVARGGVALTAADVQAAVRATADATAVVPAPTLGVLVTAALEAARAQSRRVLVEALRNELRTKAGYEAADDDAVDAFVVGPMIGERRLDDLPRWNDPITRAEAGVFVCRAVGLRNASLQTAETQAPAPHAGAPVLMRPAPGRPNAYFPPIEARELVTRIHDLEATDIYRLQTAFFSDASWAPLGANDTYTLDPDTPLLIVADTGGAAWKATADDVEFRIVAGCHSREVGCSRREPQRLVSKTWVLDLPTSDTPIKATVTVRVKHRIKGWETIGSKTMDLKVVAPAVPAPA